ncbi:MAG: ATP-binding protein [Actinomycetota bacterium]
MRHILGGVRGRILLFMLLMSTLTGVLAGVSAYYIARSSIRDQVYENLSNTARGVRGIISDAWVPTLEGQMRILAGTAEKLYGMYEGTGGVGAGLQETEGRIPGFKRLSVFLPNGYLLASSDPAYEPGRMEELGGLEAGETLVIPFRITEGLPEGEKVMTVAAPIVVDGSVAAVLAGDVPPERISESLGSLTVGRSGEIYLVNGGGQIVTIPPKAGEGSGLEILGEPMDTEGVRRVTSGESGVAEYRNYAGEEVLGSYAWMPDLGWGLLVEESADQAFSELASLRFAIILIVLGLVLIALVASLFFSQRISKPLVTLQTGAEKLALGDLDYRIELKGAAELESLAHSFNRMAVAIQTSHETMEREVVESTKDLRAINEMIAALHRIIGPDEALQKALQLFMDYTAYETGWCYLAGDEGWNLLYRRCRDDTARLMPEYIRPGEGGLGRIAQDGEAVFWDSVLESQAEEIPCITPDGSFVALPLRSHSRILGLVFLASPQRRRLSGKAKANLQAMADEAGITLENAMLYMELRRHIAELEKANLELRGLDEMKSNFISAVTHELKQPLALIGGYAQTAYDYYDSLTYAEEMHCLRVIVERTQFLTSLVEDLLDISMLEVGRIPLRCEEVDVSELARKAAEQYVNREGEQPVSVVFPEDFPTVLADAKRIEQVLSNLFSNAVKFSGGRGEIRVVGEVADGHVQVRIEDEGVGIDPLQLEKIFDRFYQADATSRRPYPGVGLGLFICRQIVEAHNGRIWAENRPEGGSAFIFELPKDPGPEGGSS